MVKAVGSLVGRQPPKDGAALVTALHREGSVRLRIDHRVELLELDTGVTRRALPVDGGAARVALRLQSGDQPRAKMLISISAWLSQLPCLGV